jgi:hypothetical protein
MAEVPGVEWQAVFQSSLRRPGINLWLGWELIPLCDIR